MFQKNHSRIFDRTFQDFFLDSGNSNRAMVIDKNISEEKRVHFFKIISILLFRELRPLLKELLKIIFLSVLSVVLEAERLFN